MNLIVDIGNTRTKFAVFKDGILQELKYSEAGTESQQLEQLLEQYPQLEKAILSATGHIPDALYNGLNQALALIPLSHRLLLPFKNLYATPETLGLDRIALVAAAAKHFPGQNCLVIDAGTCVTFDLLEADGSYRGGAISPGLRMRYEAMHHFTANLPLLDPQQIESYQGDSTANAMHAGAFRGLIHELNGAIDETKARFDDLTVILTGGDAQILRDHLKNGIFANSNFLLEGLDFLLELNALHE
ncbi:pantothenate kinase [Gilvibacter sp. SZ-19]|uniref:type III pantothenate kinase n=1 Tax=unclassified Gilvibacter TaxID=2625242 RepID=UPI000B3C020C|nr:type III pantothenate kinase [Gilvibacter sp. SZ-19]ARV12418.1 pantothenate kinase [Gilvibacter sp. SZ-19]